MGSIVTIHSYRGGTGKSNVTANLATAVAMQGKRVGVVDTDIQSPGIHVIFGFQESDMKPTLNDYLSGTCDVQKSAHDVEVRTKVPNGKVFLLPGSMDYRDIAKVLKNGYDLDRMTDGFREVIKGLSLDVLFIDTHPGLNEETMLYTVMSKLLIVLVRPDQQDYLGTAVVVDVAKKLGVPKIGLVINKLLPAFNAADAKNSLQTKFGCPVMEILPFDTGVMENGSAGVLVLQHPDLPWSQALMRLSREITASVG